MENITDILDLLITNSGLSTKSIAKKIGIAASTLNKIHNGATTNPTIENLLKIADYFNISLDQLVGKVPLNTIFENDLACIPIINLNDISIDKISSLTLQNYSHWHRIEISNSIKNHSLFAMKVTGDAMIPVFDENTVAVIDPNQKVNNKTLVLAYISHLNEFMIRKLSIDGAHKLLKPTNSDFPIIHMTDEDKILGVVITSRKDF